MSLWFDPCSTAVFMTSKALPLNLPLQKPWAWLINPRRVGGGLQYLVGLCVCVCVCMSVCYHKIAV